MHGPMNVKEGEKRYVKDPNWHSSIASNISSMHLVGFTIEIYYDARPYERQRRRKAVR
jgi:hypothetical protein